MAQVERGIEVVVDCAVDRNFAGIMECWPEEWQGPFSAGVLDVATAIRSGKTIVAVLRTGGNRETDRVVGWLIWDDRFIPGSMYLRKVAVHKDHRKKGILSLLLMHAVDLASRVSFHQIVGDLGPDSLISPDYAKRLGFEPIGHVTGLAGDGYVTTFYRLKPHSKA